MDMLLGPGSACRDVGTIHVRADHTLARRRTVPPGIVSAENPGKNQRPRARSLRVLTSSHCTWPNARLDPDGTLGGQPLHQCGASGPCANRVSPYRVD